MKINKLTLLNQWFPKGWVSTFAVNVLGVIVGIALTFGISEIIQKRNERRQVREMMQAISQELNEGRDLLTAIKTYFDQDIETYLFILDKSKWADTPMDSLEQRIKELGTDSYIPLENTVWKISQNYVISQNADNVKIAMQISYCYSLLDVIYETRKQYRERKEVLFDLYSAYFQEHPIEFMQAILDNPKSNRFIEETVKLNYYNLSQPVEQVMPYLEYVLYLVDNYDNTKKTSIDFETFKEMHSNKTE